MKRPILLCSVLVATALGLLPGQAPQKSVHVEGFVYDETGKAVDGVAVIALVSGASGSSGSGRTGAPDATGKPGVPGRYSFDVPASAPFELSFTHSQYYSMVVKDLAERKDQQISTVLFKKGAKFSAGAAHSYFQSLDRITFLAAALPKNQRKDFLSRYWEFQEELGPIGAIDFEKVNKESVALVGELLADEHRHTKGRMDRLRKDTEK